MTDEGQSRQWSRALGTALVALAVGAAVVVGVIAVARLDFSGQGGSGLSDRFDYDLDQYNKIDPALIRYEQVGEIPVAMRVLRAVAVGPDGRVFVAGDKAVHVFDADGRRQSEIALDDRPTCLAADGERLLVGVETHVEVLGPDGKRIARWDDLGDRAVLTSIAADEDNVFVADAGNKIVLRYDKSGKLLGRIGQRDAEKGIPGFVIPSPYFDLAVAPDGLLRVVNPGNHQIETYTPDGHCETPLAWGTPGLEIEGFCGCCNPVNIAMLSDGRIVTAEKGIPRVKVYSAEGRFECVVAGPGQLAPTRSITEETREEYKLLAVDLAVDSRQRVLVMDPATHSVRIFQHKDKSTEATP